MMFNFEKLEVASIPDGTMIRNLVDIVLGNRQINEAKLKALRFLYAETPEEKRVSTKFGTAAQINYAWALSRKMTSFPYSREELVKMDSNELSVLIDFMIRGGSAQNDTFNP